MLFRTFVTCCVLLKLSLKHITVEHDLSYLKYLAMSHDTANMMANHRYAAKANFAEKGLNPSVWSHSQCKILSKVCKAHRAFKISKKGCSGC